MTPRLGVTDFIRNSPSYRRNVENLGYYWSINDYMDADATIDWLSGTGRGADEAPGWTRYNAEWRYRWIDRFLSGGLASSYTRQGDGVKNLARVVEPQPGVHAQPVASRERQLDAEHNRPAADARQPVRRAGDDQLVREPAGPDRSRQGGTGRLAQAVLGTRRGGADVPDAERHDGYAQPAPVAELDTELPVQRAAPDRHHADVAARCTHPGTERSARRGYDRAGRTTDLGQLRHTVRDPSGSASAMLSASRSGK